MSFRRNVAARSGHERVRFPRAGFAIQSQEEQRSGLEGQGNRRVALSFAITAWGDLVLAVCHLLNSSSWSKPMLGGLVLRS